MHLESLATTTKMVLIFLEGAPTPLQSVTCKQKADTQVMQEAPAQETGCDDANV